MRLFFSDSNGEFLDRFGWEDDDVSIDFVGSHSMPHGVFSLLRSYMVDRRHIGSDDDFFESDIQDSFSLEDARKLTCHCHSPLGIASNMNSTNIGLHKEQISIFIIGKSKAHSSVTYDNYLGPFKLKSKFKSSFFPCAISGGQRNYLSFPQCASPFYLSSQRVNSGGTMCRSHVGQEVKGPNLKKWDSNMEPLFNIGNLNSF